MRVLVVVAAVLLLTPRPVLAHASPNLRTVWRWYGTCPNATRMTVEVRFRTKRVYSTAFPICLGEASDREHKPLVFSLTAAPRIFGEEFAALNTPKIEGNIWLAGGESTAILLGVSFTTQDRILLNTIHVASATTVSETPLAKGSVISSSVRAAVANAGCNFPAGATVCKSPNGQWSLRWQEATASLPHLLLVAERGKPERQLLTFARHIGAMWSPDSRYLAITDHSGSSDSDVLVADLQSDALINVEDAMRRTLKSLAPVYANGHRYFSAVRWQTAALLAIEVRAYDAEPGREVRTSFVFDAANGTVR